MREKKSVERKVFLVSVIFMSVMFCVFSSSIVLATPYGANFTGNYTETAPLDTPQSHEAHAGNVTELTVHGYSTTLSWQGYFGNVTGTIQLADASDHVMYNWSDLDPKGEVYASRNDSVAWSYIECFNYSADNTDSTGISDIPNAGNTEQHGIGYLQLYSDYDINVSDPDGVNLTFNRNDHPEFFTNNLQFGTGECMNTRLFNSTGNGDFNEALLYEPTGASVVFASILQVNADGFQGGTNDFEMLVLDDAHGTDTAPTTYYFYLELN